MPSTPLGLDKQPSGKTGRPLNLRWDSVVRLAAKSPGSRNSVQISNTPPPPKKKVAEMSKVPNILFLTELQDYLKRKTIENYVRCFFDWPPYS